MPKTRITSSNNLCMWAQTCRKPLIGLEVFLLRAFGMLPDMHLGARSPKSGGHQLNQFVAGFLSAERLELWPHQFGNRRKLSAFAGCELFFT
jgi:hypothetical protein